MKDARPTRGEGTAMKAGRKRAAVSMAAVAMFTVMLCGCAAKAPEPIEPLSYSFRFEAPEGSDKKLGITVGIVKPQWGKDSFTYDAPFALKENERLLQPNMAASRGPIPNQARSLLNEFTSAVGTEYEAMLTRRGFETMGPFSEIDEMTYPQKQASNMVLIPELHMNISAQPEVVAVDVVKGTATIRAELLLQIFEPLSKEKLWLKRISFESEPFQYQYKFDYDSIENGYQRKYVKWDNRAQRMAGALVKFYDEIMNTSWKYFSPDELVVLKTQSDEIRSKKRF